MRVFTTVTALTVLLASAVTAQAQYSGSMSGGQTGRGTAGLFGQRSLGAGVQGRSGSGGQGGQGMSQMNDGAGQLSGNERFLRGNRQAGSFVGADSTDSSFVGAAQAGAGSGMGGSGMTGSRGRSQFGSGSGMGMGGGMYGGGMGMGGGMYGGGMGMGGGMNGMQRGMGGMNSMYGSNNRNRQRNRGQQSRSARPTPRTAFQLGFSAPAVNTAASSRRISSSLQRSSRLRATGPVQVEIVGDTAVLRGTVQSASDRSLAQQVVLLEPGVARVQNDLVVAGAANEELPTAAAR